MNKKGFFTMLLIFLLAFPLYAFARTPQNVVKLGDVTSYTGEVMVRTKGVWKKLDVVPYPVFSSDKVVTGRGRAEIRFVDGGVLKLDMDSNISIVEKKVFKENITARRINVLVGNLWFDIKVKKGKSVEFRTPSMVADIKGTSGKLRIDPDGRSYYRLVGGSADFYGNVRAIPRTEAVGPPDVTAAVLPQSDPAVQNLPVQRAASEAVEAHSKAALAASRADAETEAVMAAKDQSVKAVISATRTQVAVASAKAAAARSVASLEVSKAQVATVKEALLEAERVKDTKAVVAAKKSMEQADVVLSKVQTLSGKVVRVAQEVQLSVTPGKAAANAAVAVTVASASAANTAALQATAQLAITQVTGDMVAAKTAEKQVVKIQQAADSIEAQVKEVTSLAERITIGVREATEFGLAAEAVSNAASTNAASAQALAKIAMETTAGDTASLRVVEEAAALTQQLALTANMAAENAVAAAKRGNLRAVQAAADVAATAARETEGIGREAVKITVTIEEEAPEEEVAPLVEEVIPPPDSEDLPISSPSS